MSSFKADFNPWPCGKVPENFQRLEIKMLKEKGYDLSDAEIIKEFERKISVYSGCKYGVAVDCATNGLFLALKYLKYIEEPENYNYDTITIPSHTFMSVPATIINAGFKVWFEEIDWSGVYQLKPTRIWDGSVRFTKNMFIGENALHILSFQYKKRLPIGRGGMVLTNDKNAMSWIKQARQFGRHMDIDQWHDIPEIIGWNMYMTPDDAARGILIFDQLSETNPDSGCQNNYQDLSKMQIFKIRAKKFYETVVEKNYK